MLGCAEGKSNQQMAAELGIWPQTVGKWRRRFLESRLDGLADKPRPGARPEPAARHVGPAALPTPRQQSWRISWFTLAVPARVPSAAHASADAPVAAAIRAVAAAREVAATVESWSIRAEMPAPS
ncbi:helix-turn-helix domain-containing protein [Streptomyces sp. 4503]|uniref:Helix-turn-helix domain-containing protein n=1 Tax=Streptomyces niphimycinicus TaxID=2842201 RepID=A0ABS6CPH0_9ACTN|nr:helix-turn-helix domain-containing protein [Streptomyces niphimycinicus]